MNPKQQNNKKIKQKKFCSRYSTNKLNYESKTLNLYRVKFMSILPQNLEAEIGVLGSLLIENSVADEIIGSLDKSYFSTPAHQTIYEVIVYLFENNIPIDPVAVKEELQKRDCLDKVGGYTYIMSLIDAVFSAGNVLFYSKIVREKGIIRQLIKVSQEIIETSRDESISLPALLDKAESLIFGVTQKNTSNEPAHIKDMISNLLMSIENNSCGLRGVNTGFYDLDELLTGLPNSALIIVAGRPSMGKTSFALNVAANVSIDYGVGTLIFSLEMSKEQLAQNIICSRAKVSPHRITSGKIEHEEYSRITSEALRISNSPIDRKSVV